MQTLRRVTNSRVRRGAAQGSVISGHDQASAVKWNITELLARGVTVCPLLRLIQRYCVVSTRWSVMLWLYFMIFKGWKESDTPGCFSAVHERHYNLSTVPVRAAWPSVPLNVLGRPLSPWERVRVPFCLCSFGKTCSLLIQTWCSGKWNEQKGPTRSITIRIFCVCR